MSADWFCKIADKKVGPLNAQQLKTFVAKGQLKPEHLVRRGSEGPWVPAGRIKGLFTCGTSSPTPPQGKAPSTAKPLPKAVMASTPQANALPAAAEAPPPPADIPEELSLGGHQKHHAKLNVDKLDFATTPVMVSQRKMKSGLQSMKQSEQKKATVILLSVIGGGTVFGLIVFIWAAASGMLSGPAKKVEEPSPAARLAAAASLDSGKPKVEAETKPAPKPAQAAWPTNFRTPLTEPTNVGDFQVTVLKPERGAPPAGVKTGDTEVLIVPVNVQLKDGAKKNVEFTGWDDPQVKKDVLLRDDKDGKGNTYDFLGQVFKEGDDAKAIAKHRIQVRLIFELPAKLAKPIYLALPASALHVEGPMIAYKLEGVKETSKSP
jgi:hypothetical protein